LKFFIFKNANSKKQFVRFIEHNNKFKNKNFFEDSKQILKDIKKEKKNFCNNDKRQKFKFSFFFQFKKIVKDNRIGLTVKIKN